MVCDLVPELAVILPFSYHSEEGWVYASPLSEVVRIVDVVPLKCETKSGVHFWTWLEGGESLVSSSVLFVSEIAHRMLTPALCSACDDVTVRGLLR